MNLYIELVGGLGDAIMRLYFSASFWYNALDRMLDKDRATVVLMSHSPYLHEIFRWHPKRDQIGIRDLGFNTTFHPWENKEWRIAHGLPSDAVCPPYGPAETLTFYPSPTDELLLERLRREKFVVMAATASIEQKSVPQQIREEVARDAIRAGFKVLVVGRRRYFKDGRTTDIEVRDGVIDAVDSLSVPGTIEAVKLSAGVITAHSAALHMAWSEKRPVFLLYDEATGKQLLPGGPVGYMHGMNREDTDHMFFADYTKERFRGWIGKR